MPITQAGQLNTTALTVPDLYIQIVPPASLALNGVPSNTIGVVGTAVWGPKNSAQVIGSFSQYVAAFGPINPRKYDMGTHVATATLQGAASFRCVRVTDNTDTAATIANGTSITFTGLYTGSLGNTVTVQLAAGRRANTYKAIVGIGAGLTTLPSQGTEVFDNIAGAATATWAVSTAYAVGAQIMTAAGNVYIATAAGTSSISGTGPTGTTNAIADGTVTWSYLNTTNLFWTNLALALNTGNAFRGPSARVVATAGFGVALPVAGTTYTLAGGTDGASTVTATHLIGLDVAPRTGMYALRATPQPCSIMVLADCDTSTTWTTSDGMAQQEGLYNILTAPSGDTLTNAATTKANAGLDSYSSKLMFGDWIYWADQINGYTRLVSPQGFVAGKLAALAPNQTSQNKPLVGVAGSQKSGLGTTGQAQTYASADLQALFGVGIDVISNPQPGGTYWGVRGGFNSSSNPGVYKDSYTRMTNYIAVTLNSAMGQYVGAPITPTLFQNISGTISSFMTNLLTQGLLAQVAGALPFGVTCNSTNNPQARTSLGYVQADVQVTYEGITDFLLVNLQGGAGVTVTQANAPTQATN
jgi:hypothetical protein